MKEIILWLFTLLFTVILAGAVVDLRLEILELKRIQTQAASQTEILKTDLADTRTDLADQVRLLDSQVQFCISGGWK